LGSFVEIVGRKEFEKRTSLVVSHTWTTSFHGQQVKIV